ncbi:sugar phosphate isomerase/epimerase [Candidatus Woesearchaeota archaeon]|nr:sugar phosphate isomerase/epimerase [Candidatus Woesearchaeota archaeon]
MAFDSDYWHALDKQSASNLEISPKDIGISMGAGDVLQSMSSAINMGAGTVELGFTGAGKGGWGQGGTTPEMFGKDKREAIRQLAKINDVHVSTHASIGISNLSGMTNHGFDRQAQQQTLNEIRRTVDFAADVTRGGPVTVHTAEFPRTVAGRFKNFKLFPEEETKTHIYLVDNVTGEIKQSMTRETQLPFLKIKEGTKDEPVLNKEGYPDFEMLDFKKYKAKKEKEGQRFRDDEEAAQKFFYEYMDQEKARLTFEKKRWSHQLKRVNDQFDYVQQIKKSVDDQYRTDPEAAKHNAMKWVEQLHHAPQPGTKKYNEFLNDPIRFLNETVTDFDHERKFMADAAVAYGKQEAQLNQQQERTVPISQVGKQRTSETLANAAIYAWEREQAQKLDKPLFISPENIFPEGGYGSHPEEMREMVVNARKAMVDKLCSPVERGGRSMGRGEAEQIANDHIKATFDVGHAYTWKKFFEREPGETSEQADKRFNKWMLGEVDKLNKEGIIGHVHLSDNFGYYDEHLTPGTGSAPLKEFVDKMRKSGHMEPMIAEGGAQSNEEYYQAMTGGWKHLASSPIYRTAKWTDIEDSYFGRTSSPTYMVGKYAPSQEYLGSEKGAPFWTGLGLE